MKTPSWQHFVIFTSLKIYLKYQICYLYTYPSAEICKRLLIPLKYHYTTMAERHDFRFLLIFKFPAVYKVVVKRIKTLMPIYEFPVIKTSKETKWNWDLKYFSIWAQEWGEEKQISSHSYGYSEEKIWKFYWQQLPCFHRKMISIMYYSIKCRWNDTCSTVNTDKCKAKQWVHHACCNRTFSTLSSITILNFHGHHGHMNIGHCVVVS